MTREERICALKREGKSLTEIAVAVQGDYQGLNLLKVVRRVRHELEMAGLTAKKQPTAQQDKPSDPLERSSIEYKADGSVVSEKFIMLREGEEMTPEVLLAAHGLKASCWEVVSYKNNFWNSQLKGGTLQISYQSKLTARPRKSGIDLDDVAKFFNDLDRKNFKPPALRPVGGSMMAEINISDLHLGKLCWHGDTPENYDHKIAQRVFFQIINEIIEQLRGKPIEYITFVWTNDFFNSDNPEKTTTAGTPQDTDVRDKKLFNVGVEMLARAIEMLEPGEDADGNPTGIAPVKTFYTPSNHDESTAYHALQFIRAWFRNDPNVDVNQDAYPRKYILYGKTLIGYTHGDKENDKGSKEKASRLASLMPIEAIDLWGKAIYHEMHAHHLHSEQMVQEINGVIVRRISSPTALDTYHTTYGYMGAVRKAQVFLYDHQRGPLHVINVPVTQPEAVDDSAIN